MPCSGFDKSKEKTQFNPWRYVRQLFALLSLWRNESEKPLPMGNDQGLVRERWVIGLIISGSVFTQTTRQSIDLVSSSWQWAMGKKRSRMWRTTKWRKEKRDDGQATDHSIIRQRRRTFFNGDNRSFHWALVTNEPCLCSSVCRIETSLLL